MVAVRNSLCERRCWHVLGQIQGVGFRPFIHRLAHEHGVTGFTFNNAAGVTIEAQGRADQLNLFAQAIKTQCPPLASIDHLTATSLPPIAHETDFTIRQSDHDRRNTVAAVTFDAAVCDDCLREMRDANDRRHGYGLINCTNCGPRFSIIRRVPYDRPNTTMASFDMCPACAAEYGNPGDRRFHAQPIACHRCGPTLQLLTTDGGAACGDAILETARRLQRGEAVAIKGLGGFHVAAAAADEQAVARLRRGKHRAAKPFALMVRSLATAEALVQLSAEAKALMQSPACPIVLAARRNDATIPGVAPNVAPHQHRLGVMLPYTPIHHLLFDALPFDALVMTSGNVTDEPLVTGNAEARERLGELCDAILLHDRPIERPVDDSVVLDMGDALLPIRRARGFVPMRLPLPESIAEAAGDGLCVGGELKNTVGVVRDGGVILSQHLGDLKHPLAFEQFRKAAADLQALFQVEPQWIAHDLHPQYLSTQHARKVAAEHSRPLIAVQHHHAHAAALMAEHGRTQPMLAVICDGVGHGDDGGIWGGELLHADLTDATRLARLRPLRLPGGDAAAKDTRRCGMALLHMALGDAFEKHEAARRLVADDSERAMWVQMVRRNINCTQTSAAGRYFDGIAALLGVCDHNDFEAQAPMRLEALASQADVPCDDPHRCVVQHSEVDDLDLSPFIVHLLSSLTQGVPAADLAAQFHAQLAEAWADVAARHAHRLDVNTVGLSGGVFCNQILTERTDAALHRHGLRVLRHRLVPPNDGGIAYGQAAVAAARLAQQRA